MIFIFNISNIFFPCDNKNVEILFKNIKRKRKKDLKKKYIFFYYRNSLKITIFAFTLETHTQAR